MEGGCLCQSVRFRFTGTPLCIYQCHCTRCQRRTGSAFGMSMHVFTREFEIITGDPLTQDVPNAQRNFCPSCGQIVSIRSHRVTVTFPGCFDDTKWVMPDTEVWTRSAQPWVTHNPALRLYETQPGHWSELYPSDWKERLA